MPTQYILKTNNITAILLYFFFFSFLFFASFSFSFFLLLLRKSVRGSRLDAFAMGFRKDAKAKENIVYMLELCDRPTNRWLYVSMCVIYVVLFCTSTISCCVVVYITRFYNMLWGCIVSLVSCAPFIVDHKKNSILLFYFQFYYSTKEISWPDKDICVYSIVYFCFFACLQNWKANGMVKCMDRHR